MLYIVLIALIISLDQFTKFLATEYLKPIMSYPLIDGVLHLTYTENSGAAFSILKDKQGLLMVLTTIGMLFILWYLLKLLKHKGRGLLKTSVVFIIAGGVGNLADRIRMSYVVDFIDFRFINFAIFNVADIFIVVGAGLLIIDTFFVSKSLKDI